MTERLRQKTVTGLVWSSIERLSTQSVTFLLGLIMARLLTPEDYGIIAMLIIFLSVSNLFIESGFPAALIRKPDRTEEDMATAFYFNIFAGITTYIILFFAAPYIAVFYNLPMLTQITRMIGLTLPLNALASVQQAILIAQINFKTLARISLSASAISGITGVILAYLGYGVYALVTQSVLLYLLRVILLWLLVGWRPVHPFSKKAFRELYAFGVRLFASRLLDTIYRNIYLLVIGKLFSTRELGNYSRATQFAHYPSLNFTDILQRVTFPIFSTIQNEDERLAAAYRQMIRMSGFIIFPLMIGVAVVAQPLILLVLTDKWEGVTLFLQILCLALMWYPIHALNLNLLQVKGRSDLFLKIEVVKKAIEIIILCITLPIGLPAVCWGQVLSSLLSLVINTHYTGKLIHIGFLIQMKDLSPFLTHSLSAGAAAWFISRCFDPPWLQLTIALLTGAVVYLSLTAVFSRKEVNELRSLLQKQT